ncbi:Glutamyl-tRNA(Gln) amidotransferase subunit A [Variovorax sp. PBS-H4]|uniref:amidase n=1 Tax=Variovorax sp. PBS-H4 TaxID=434008 RepID=UPI001316DF0F|nr:amidase [Variovorax sp. PBS-H4]VTU23502.1 Glutamyl-tRNA(Gln) amidotransferase subunit A [Variovorax sp. PBS-H4]
MTRISNPGAPAASASAGTLPPDVCRWGATDIAARIRDGAISSVEVTQAFHARIDAVNPRLNAIVHADRERALQMAREADALRARAPQEMGCLHGVPVTIKLNVDVAGEATTNGVPAFADRIAPADSAVVANLRRAGAVILGRTNVPPFSFRWFTENPLHGRTLNPWRTEITSGGSSGGAAVAAASGMCALAHGTDIAGSIRYPAYVNGVVGLRPTPGRVPACHPTTTTRFLGLQLFSAQGVLARGVRDVELGLRAMAAEGASDPTWISAPLDFPDDGAPVRVACVDEIPDTRLAPEVKAALSQAARSLEAAGYRVERVVPPGIDEALEIWLAVVMNEVRMGMLSAVEAMQDASILSSVRSMAACAPAPELHAYATALARRDVLRREWNEFFERYPLLLMPTSCRAPMPWGEDLQGPEKMRELLADQSPLIAVAALSLPGLHVPTGLQAGLPSGVQLVAASFRERRLLEAARIIERDAEPFPDAAMNRA